MKNKITPRLGARDLKVIAYAFKHYKNKYRVPTATEIGKRFKFSRQGGDYYLTRMASFGAVVFDDQLGIYSVTPDTLKPPFKKMYREAK